MTPFPFPFPCSFLFGGAVAVSFALLPAPTLADPITLRCGPVQASISCAFDPDRFARNPEGGQCNDGRARIAVGNERRDLPRHPRGWVAAARSLHTPKGLSCYRLGGREYLAVTYSVGSRECFRCRAVDLYDKSGRYVREYDTVMRPVIEGVQDAVSSVWVQSARVDGAPAKREQ